MKPIGAIFLLSLCACASSKLQKEIQLLESDFNDHVGFMLYDPTAKKTVVQYQSDRYFIPASNTKIFTFFASLKTLPDSIPALYYVERGDSLIFWGSGDPSLFYEYLPESPVYEFLIKAGQSLYYSDAHYYDQHFGEGWAWDDYTYAFSAEKSSMPLYGNVLKVARAQQYLSLSPAYFKPYFFMADSTKKSQVLRDFGSNTYYYAPANDQGLNRKIPFRTTGLLTANLLSDTLKRAVRYVNLALPENHKTLKGTPVDSLYKEMMQQSDNFIAEQLLLTCSGWLTDSLNSQLAISKIKARFMQNIPDEPIWKDGSGLSRYNLFTPRSIVWLWEQILTVKPREELLPLLATGGVSGTLQNYYKSTTPYIFGKTGTLSNNHTLSGYLITKKGKLLIFSFMNNNYPTSSLPVKKRMEQILWGVHQKY